MPLKNRVTPDGTIVSVPQRGMFMGNRGGRIHDPETRQLTGRKWASRRWICCVTQFSGRKRQLMGNSYTELFFLDEVTALAAGHRPCFECRRSDANAFLKAWSKVHKIEKGSKADQMDRLLHDERCGEHLSKSVLPEDAVGNGILYKQIDRFFVQYENAWLSWSFAGYAPEEPDHSMPMKQITVPSVVATMKAGYEPKWHPSAESAFTDC